MNESHPSTKRILFRSDLRVQLLDLFPGGADLPRQIFRHTRRLIPFDVMTAGVAFALGQLMFIAVILGDFELVDPRTIRFCDLSFE